MKAHIGRIVLVFALHALPSQNNSLPVCRYHHTSLPGSDISLNNQEVFVYVIMSVILELKLSKRIQLT